MGEYNGFVTIICSKSRLRCHISWCKYDHSEKDFFLYLDSISPPSPIINTYCIVVPYIENNKSDNENDYNSCNDNGDDSYHSDNEGRMENQIVDRDLYYE